MTSVPATHFERLYASSSDPWGLERRWYERRKRHVLLASLPHERYRSGFEPGCSIGVLTGALAGRCDRLLATDAAEAAVAAARRRLAAHRHVSVARRSVPMQWPEERFDLIVLSELLYYFDDDDLGELLDAASRSLVHGGTLAAAHWRYPQSDSPRTGDDAHETLLARPGFAPLAHHVESDFVLDVLIRDDGSAPVAASVAAATGVIGNELL